MMEEETTVPKLYVVTRQDLSAGQQMCQALHAAVDFCFEHPELGKKWHDESNTICVLSVADEPDLLLLLAYVMAYDIYTATPLVVLGPRLPVYTIFREPDQEWATTAVAFEPAVGPLLSTLPLALSEVVDL